MRTLVFGATGMLGKAVVRRWTGDEITGVGSAQADIRNPEQVEKTISEAKPDWVILAAAYTDVDGCELNPQLAAAVNTRGAVNVAKVAARLPAKVLFISTDYVFDGKKTSPYETGDARNPINVYGKTKAEAEERISQILPGCSIVRTSWLFGPGGKCFPDTILRLAAERKQIDVVDDQRGCPTYTVDLADAIVRLCRLGAQGIIHCTNQGECSWYEFAREIIRQAGLKTTIRPTPSEKYVRPAERPRYSVLSGSSLAQFGIAMRPWQSTLPAFLAERG
jgi:dTDP-4-dehydrorhamnose reductase